MCRSADDKRGQNGNKKRQHVSRSVLAGILREDKRKENHNTIYRVFINKRTNVVGGGAIKKNTKQYSGNIYCVTVPGGRILLRRDNQIFVSGNSGNPVEVVTETVFHLWETFGGTVNSKGYKVLDPHIKAIYGDSITPQRAEKIYEWLKSEGFAANNVSLGVGSFSMQCLEEDGTLKPYTRDTFGIAIKATYCEGANGNPIPIFKNPKECSFKKSQKGCCVVIRDPETHEYVCHDEFTFADTENALNNRLVKVFENGNITKEYSLKEIRDRLHGGKF